MHTLTAYQHDLAQVQEFLGAQGLTDLLALKTLHLRGWLMALHEQHLEPRSIARKLATIRSFYKFCSSQGALTNNPTAALRTPKIPKRNPGFVPESDAQALGAGNAQKKPEAANTAPEKEIDPEWQLFHALRRTLVLELLYSTGIRLSELIGIKDRDISKAGGTLTVIGKRNKMRVIPLLPNLLAQIEQYQAERRRLLPAHDSGTLLLTDAGEPLYPVWVQRLVKAALQDVTTLEKKSPHVLRHTFATHLLNNGADLMAIKEMMGHSSLAATQVYTHNAIQEMKAAYAKAHPKGSAGQSGSQENK